MTKVVTKTVFIEHAVLPLLHHNVIKNNTNGGAYRVKYN